MMPYLLTGLAGVMLGIVAMRLFAARAPDETRPAPGPTDNAPTGAKAAGNPARIALFGAGGMALIAAAVFALRTPSPDSSALPNPPVAAPGAAGAKPLDDVDTMIARLAKRLETNPDGEGFRMLGWSYLMTGHPEKAIDPYKRALVLLPNSALVHAGYGEALTAVAKNTVTPEAKAEFDKARAIDPKEPRTRYFEGLWQDQHGAGREAVESWIALINSAPADAPWQADVQRQLKASAGRLGIDVSGRIKPAPAQGNPGATGGAAMAPGGGAPALDPGVVKAASAMPEGQRQAMVSNMVDGLAAKLKTNPRDPDRWVLLLRSRMVMKAPDQAASDLSAARAALKNDGEGLARVEAAAKELGVPGAR